MKIVLIGAYGYTAKLICKLLHENKIAFDIAGINPKKLSELTTQFSYINKTNLIDLRHSLGLQALINYYDIFINCAGPFTEESSGFIEQLAKTKNKIYFDISGELEFVKKSREENHKLALENQSTIVHACAFESLLVDLGLKILSERTKNFVNIKTYYQFDKSRPSPGTKITMKLNNLRKQTYFSDSVWQGFDNQKTQHNFCLSGEGNYIAVAYPLPEIAFAQWQYPCGNIGSYLLLAKDEALFIGKTKNDDSKNSSETLADLKTRKTAGPSELERTKQKFRIIIQTDSNLSNASECLMIKGGDMYLITAKIILLAVESVLKSKPNFFGVVNPALLFIGKEQSILTKLSLTSNQSTIV